jgi:nicotinamide riboside kinase
MIRVAFTGAPDSGKTTLAKMVSAKMNLKGYVPAYVHEFARDYITKWGIRPNTVAEQFYVLRTQEKREREMCSSSTQIMYTDCPIMLSYIYAIDLVRDSKDLTMLGELYEETLRLMGVAKNKEGGLRDSLALLDPRYDLIFYLRPFRETVKDDVRAQDWDRIGRLDDQVKAFLVLHGIVHTELTDANIEHRVEYVEQAIEHMLEMKEKYA